MSEEIKDLSQHILILTAKIDNLKEDQLEIKEGVAKIKEAIYNPDNGLYARVRNVEIFRSVATKSLWILLSGLVGLTTSTILLQFVGK